MTPPSTDLAYWMEAAELRGWADWYRAMADLPGNPFGASVDGDGDLGTISLRAQDSRLFNRCLGLGVARPAVEADVDAAIAAFHRAGVESWTIQLSPLARPAALERWLVERGLVPGFRWGKFWRDPDDPPDAHTDLRIEEVGPEAALEFDRTLGIAFEVPTDLPPGSAIIGRRGWHAYAAFDGPEVVGTAALYVDGEVGWLGFGATLPSHRGRGSQSAMFRRRIVDAAALGARVLVTETGEDTPESPNPSYRNMLRAGFRLGYLRQNWKPAET